MLSPSDITMLSLQRRPSEPARSATVDSAVAIEAPFQTSAIAIRKRVSVSEVPWMAPYSSSGRVERNVRMAWLRNFRTYPFRAKDQRL